MNKVTNGVCLICFVTGYCIGQLVVYGYSQLKGHSVHYKVYGYSQLKGREDESTRSDNNS
jgi:hypothetical protein